MTIYARILLTGFILLSALSCSREEAPLPYQYDREVIAIFPPEGIIAHTSSELIYRSLFKVADDLKLLFRPILPDTYEEGLSIITELTEDDRIGSNRLIILADPMYAEDLVMQGMSKNIVDTDSTKVLVLGTYTDQPNLYNAYIPMYGVMYKAGYIAGKMTDVNSAGLVLPTNKYSFYKESSQGFIDILYALG